MARARTLIFGSLAVALLVAIGTTIESFVYASVTPGAFPPVVTAFIVFSLLVPFALVSSGFGLLGRAATRRRSLVVRLAATCVGAFLGGTFVWWIPWSFDSFHLAASCLAGLVSALTLLSIEGVAYLGRRRMSRLAAPQAQA